jgi:preprotein translocase subunit YajC
MFINLLAQAASPAPSGGALTALNPLVMMIFIMIIMYYLMIRPQMKRQKEQQRLIASLKTGDRVVTASGIHGLISNVKDRTVILKIADNVKIEVEKSAIGNVLAAEASK